MRLDFVPNNFNISLLKMPHPTGRSYPFPVNEAASNLYCLTHFGNDECFRMARAAESVKNYPVASESVRPIERIQKKRVAGATLKVMLFVMPLFDVLLFSVLAVSSPSTPIRRDSREGAGRSWC